MKITKFYLMTILVILLSGVSLFAGNMASTDTQGNPDIYTLDDIYNRLNDGTEGSKATFQKTTSTPGSTGHTVNEIMGKAPAKDNTDGAKAADVLTGKKFWGLTDGEWGLQTGTASGGAAYPAPVPKTGQTKCSTDRPFSEQACPVSGVPGQDGDLQKGVEVTGDRFTDNKDGTVTDNLTGLIWLKNANCANAERNWKTALNDILQLK